MTGHWVDGETDEEVYPNYESVSNLVEAYVDSGDADDDIDEFSRDDFREEIVDKFYWNCGHDMEDLYDDIRKKFKEYKTKEILESCMECDFILGCSTYTWVEDHDVRRVQVQAFGFTEYNADETTLEEHMKHNYPCLKDFSVVTRELPKEE